MASLPQVALIGATGNLGAVILEKLLAAGFPVTILTRQGSTSTSNLPAHPNQTIKEVDYSSADSLAAAIKGNQVVISTVAGGSTGDQKRLIDAALASGTVTRFIPSDFGSDIFHPKNIDSPVFAGKVATAKYLEHLTEANPRFSYTSIMNNAFFDWCLKVGFLVNAKTHTATLWNGGDRPISVTTLDTVGDAVIAVLNHLDTTANQTFKIHDAVVTQNQVIEIIKKIDGQEWSTEVKSSKEREAESYAELKKPNPDFGAAMGGFLTEVIWGEGREVFNSQVDNTPLGLKTKSEAEIEEIVRKIVQA